MNIYGKVAIITNKLQEANIKKSGKNKYAGYNYFELGDIVPHINKLTLEYQVMIQFTFTKDRALMRIINIEEPSEVLEYESPMAEIALKGAHGIQNLGALETYSRRYLLMSAFNIVEHDYFDAVQGREETEKKQLISEIRKMCRERAVDDESKKSLLERFPSLKRMEELDILTLKKLKSNI